jgi:hypothetical protein
MVRVNGVRIFRESLKGEQLRHVLVTTNTHNLEDVYKYAPLPIRALSDSFVDWIRMTMVDKASLSMSRYLTHSITAYPTPR